MTVFVGCPEGCRYHTASAVYDLVSRLDSQALESDYVSSKLNEWIDLIFGFKQQCPAAIEAVNVFHHLFYEGNVDIYAIDDPLKKTATIGFINNFGQIPKQVRKFKLVCCIIFFRSFICELWLSVIGVEHTDSFMSECASWAYDEIVWL